MTFGQVKLHLLAGFTVLLFLTILGLSSEVSLSASFYRGFVGGLVFSLITFSIHNILRLTVFNSEGDKPKAEPSSKFDFSIGDDGVSVRGRVRGTADGGPGEDLEEDQQGSPEVSVPSDAHLSQAKQIDPQVSRIINEDPERVAELVRKMGLDD